MMNNSNFIYVFSDKDKDALISLGYTLIKSDERAGVFIFANNKDIARFAASDINFVLSSTLTF